MILEIFDSQSRERIGLITTFEFAQYTDSFYSNGTFSVTVPYTEKSLPLLVKENFILFDEKILGIIKKRKKTTSKSTSVSITGMLLKHALHYRVFDKTKTYNGPLVSVAQQMVADLFLINADAKRNTTFISISTDPLFNPSSDNIKKQITGDYLDVAENKMLESKGLAYDLVPVITKYNEQTGVLTNISTFEFRVLKPVDRSIENIDGNIPVVFDMELNNLSSLEYEEDAEEYCTTAFVAGEGEGVDRVVVETGDIVISGFNRKELYVDARDIQSTDENGILIPSDTYNDMLKQRGSEYLEECKVFESFEGNIIDGNIAYKYGIDLYKGDIVSIIDRQLGVTVSANITSVTKSLTKTGEKLDLTFGYEKSNVKTLLKKRGVI